MSFVCLKKTNFTRGCCCFGPLGGGSKKKEREIEIEIRTHSKWHSYIINPDSQFGQCSDGLINTQQFNDEALLFCFSEPFGILVNNIHNSYL